MTDRIRIGKACPASWDDMTPCGDGRFCNHCRKVVIDLSQCTAAEARARVAGGGHCVRLRIDVAGHAAFAGAAIAGVMALAACEGGNDGVSARANTNATGNATVQAPGGVAGNTIVAGQMVLGEVAPSLDRQWAVELALAAVRERESAWTQLTADLVQAGNPDDPWDRSAIWVVRVHRVLQFRADGSAELAQEPGYRVELRGSTELLACARES